MDSVFEAWALEKTRSIQKVISIFIVLDFLHWISFIVATMYGEKISTLMWIRFSSWPIFYHINKSLRYSRMLVFFMLISGELVLFDQLAKDSDWIYVMILFFQVMHILKNFVANSPFENVWVTLQHYASYGFALWYLLYLSRVHIRDILFFPATIMVTAIHEYRHKNKIISEARGRAEIDSINQRNTESIMFSPDGIAIIDTEDNLILVNQAMLDVFDAQDEISLIQQLTNAKIEGEPLLQKLRTNKQATIGKVEMKLKERKPNNELIISGRDISAHLEAVAQQKRIAKYQREQAEIEMELRDKNLQAAIAQIEVEQERKLRVEQQLEAAQARIQLEQERQKHVEEQLEQERRHIEFMNSLLRFTSHEFKTPTYAIVSTLEMAMDTWDINTQIQEYLDICKVSSKQILYLSHNLMDYSALWSDQFVVNKQHCQLVSLIEECEMMVRILAERKGLDLIIRMEPDLPESVYVDSNRMAQVILNLLSNAIKFTKVGHVILKVQNSQEHKINISVIDRGVGIADDNLPCLFQQGSMFGNISDNLTGSGFGLHISNRLLEAMEGSQLRVSSKEGEGTVFNFDIPISSEWVDIEIGDLSVHDVANELDNAIYVDTKNLESATRNIFKMTDISYECPDVLIVDDTEFNRFGLRLMLEKQNISVAEAIDGQDAIEKVLGMNETGLMFKLIIMDVEMPIRNGWDATSELLQLKNDGQIPELCPIVGHTAYTLPEDIQQCLDCGMETTLKKPPSIADIQNIKETYIDIQRVQQSQLDIQSNQEAQIEIQSILESQIAIQSVQESLIDVQSNLESQIDIQSIQDSLVDVQSNIESQIDIQSVQESLLCVERNIESQIDIQSLQESQMDLESNQQPQGDIQSVQDSQIDIENIDQPQILAFTRVRFDRLVLRAVKALKEPGGSSISAISKFLNANIKDSNDSNIKATVKRLIKRKDLIKIRSFYKLREAANQIEKKNSKKAES